MRQCIRHIVVVAVVVLLGVPAVAATVLPAGSAVPGEIVMKVRNGASTEDMAGLERLADAELSKRLAKLGSGTLWRMRSRSKSTEALAEALRRNPNVEYAEPNYVVRLAATPNDTSYTSLWGLHNTGQPINGTAGSAGADIDAESAWNVTTGSASVVVGVIDTGIDYTHPDLAANMWSNPGGKGNALCAAGTFGFNAITGTCDPKDDHNHGTHVAGTIGASGNNGTGVTGVNWTVSLMALKFLSADGYGTTADAIEAIDFAVQAKIDGVNVRVLSNSWGGGAFSKALLDAINKANEHDILFVAAAGNRSVNTDTSAHYPSSYATPNMISVAATDNRDGLAWFSNYGPSSVHLGAPGVAVLSTVRDGGYQYFNGTSMATPHVSGVAALVLALTPALTTAELKDVILDSVDPIPSLTGKSITGGRLNAAKAVGAPASPDFALSVTPNSRTVVRGNATSYSVTVTAANGFGGSVALSVSGLPTGATAAFDPVSTSSTSTLTITTSDTTPLTTTGLTISGESGALRRSAFASLVTVSAPPLGACPSFTPSTIYTTGDYTAVTTADFNRDGKTDLAAADTDTSRVAIRLGSGTGGYRSPLFLTVGKSPLAVVATDFNGDGKPDLATANAATNDVSVLLGNGDGTFQTAVPFGAGSSPFALVAGDFNGDGDADLAVANNGSSNVSILLGEGDGTFAAAAQYAAGSGPFALTLADADRDGRIDLAVANFNDGNVSLLRGNGDGTFQAPLHTAAGQKPSSVAAGDFNGDGAVDLAVTNYASNNVSILSGNGNGTFAAAVHFAVGTNPYAVAIADFNGDGKADLATADSGSSKVSILMGNGDGSFLTPRTHAAESPQHLAIADHNGDGKPDVIVAVQSNYGYGLTFLHNTSDCAINCGTLAAAAYSSAGTTPDSVGGGDFNRDGKLDLAVVNYGSNNVSVKLGNGDGTFAAGATAGAGTSPHGVAVGDVNGDGRLDLAIASSGSNQAAILIGNGDGTFQSAVLYAAGSTPRAVAIGDFDGDGTPDLAVAARAANSVSILRGSGSGTFLAPVSYAVGTSPESVAVGDFNRDGRADVVAANSGSANVSLLLGNGDGTFQTATHFAAGTTPDVVVAADLDRDGRTDVAVANAGSNNISILLSAGDATFHTAAHYAVGSAPYGLIAADLNADGRLDLATANNGTNNVSVLIAGDGAVYSAATHSGVGTAPSSVAAGDFNGDGKPDLAAANSGAATIAVLLNTCPTPDLTVTKTHSGTFAQGQSGKTYTITVANAGGIATSGTVAVVDDLPVGLTATALSGTGWTCTVSSASCTRADALAAGASYPPITLTVKVASTAPASVTNTVTVAGGGERNTLNNVATDPTTIAPATDVIVAKSHTGNFAQGATGRVYTIRVRNLGGLATSGTISVTDTLPAGLTATALSGSGWSCSLASLTCTRGDSLAASSSYPPIALTVSVAADAPPLVTNSVTVSGGSDANTSNNTASDPTVVWSSQTCGSFAAPAYVPAGYYASGLVIADFNHDGRHDVAVANLYESNVSVLLGNGNGTFAQAVSYGTSAEARKVAGGDMDNDGNVDLIVAGTYGGEGAVVVLRGNGDGTFGGPARYSVTGPYAMNSIAVGDLDNDGALDVAATGYHGANVYIFAGNGDGTLRTALPFGTVSTPLGVAIADLDGNAASDLAVSVDGGVSVLRGNGDGTFSTAVHYPTYTGTGSVAVGDFNGDGAADLAVSSYYADGVFILLGRGDGTFRDAVEYDSRYGASSVTVSDTNADGRLDLVVANASYGAVSILLGRGDGTFLPPVMHDVGSSPAQVLVTDFNGDGKADLAVANNYGSVAILLGGCPDLTIVKRHNGDFRAGQTGAVYMITVTNAGTGSTRGAMTMKDILPSGLTVAGLWSPWGWTCDTPTLTCTSDYRILPDHDVTFSLYVNVSSAAPSSVTNTATISGGGDANSANNSASDPTTIVHVPDLTIKKTHAGAFTPGQTGVYTITVGNVGTASTSGVVTVADSLPAGMSAVSMSGTGWTCDVAASTCTRSDALGVTQAWPAITLTVMVNSASSASVTNVVFVSGGGELITNNNTAYDPTAILIPPANVTASADSATQITVTWSEVAAATTYEVWRSSSGNNFVRVGTTITPLFLDTTVSANTSHRYKVRALQDAVAGPFSSADLATTTFFTDDPIVARSTRMKAVHVQQLRTAANAVRAAAGLPAATFAEAVTFGWRIKASHLIEIQTALNEARAVFGQTQLVTGGLTAGSPIQSFHVTYLRNATK